MLLLYVNVILSKVNYNFQTVTTYKQDILTNFFKFIDSINNLSEVILNDSYKIISNFQFLPYLFRSQLYKSCTEIVISNQISEFMLKIDPRQCMCLRHMEYRQTYSCGDISLVNVAVPHYPLELKVLIVVYLYNLINFKCHIVLTVYFKCFLSYF